MADAVADRARDLRDYARPRPEARAWILIGLLLGGAAGVAYLDVAEQTFVSTAKVNVASTETEAVARVSGPAAPSTSTPRRSWSSPPSWPTTPPRSSKSDLPGILLAKRVTVTVPPNTTILDIAFSAPTALEAQAGAQAFAQAYLDNREAEAQDVLNSQSKQIESQIEDVSAELQKTTAQLSSAEDPTRKAILTARRTTLQGQLVALNASLAPLNVQSVDPGEIINDAGVPGGPRDPNPLLVLPSAVMLGLVLGLAAAVLRERLDKRIHTAADLERVFALAPLMSLTSSWISGSRVEINDKDSRGLYHTLRAQGPSGSETVLLVGPASQLAAERLSIHLAAITARSDIPTTRLSREPARDEFLDARMTIPVERGVLQLATYDELDLITDGEIRSGRLGRELQRLRAADRFVVLGMPTNDLLVDLPVLARHVDVVVVVVELGSTRRNHLNQVLIELGRSGAQQVVAITMPGSRFSKRRTPAPTSVNPAAQQSTDPTDDGPAPGQSSSSRRATPSEQPTPTLRHRGDNPVWPRHT